jgi:hypothetical protein
MASETEPMTTQNTGPQKSKLASAILPIIMGFVLAIVVVGTVAISLLFGRVSDLKTENRFLATTIENGIVSLQQSALQQRTISYWLAYPGPQTLVLSTPAEGGIAQALLKPAEEGRSAILLVAGLGELPPSSTYDIWLSREGRTIHAEEFALDATGWSTSTIYFDEPLSAFENVELTLRVGQNTGIRAGSGPTVLEGSIR